MISPVGQITFQNNGCCDLVDNVYAFDPNGGPENAVGVIRTTMVGLRKILPPHGWTIPKQSCGRGNQGFYYLEPIAANDNFPAAERRVAA